MKPWLRWVGALVVLQTLLVGFYWSVEHKRAPGSGDELGTEPPELVNMALPPLSVVRRDGSRSLLKATERRTLVHVWATWCTPCRKELPGLLDLPERHDVDVVALALDASWDHVERFVGGLDSSNVALVSSDQAKSALGVSSLPVTFLMESDGRFSMRFSGARDWRDDAFVESYIGAPGHRE